MLHYRFLRYQFPNSSSGGLHTKGFLDKLKTLSVSKFLIRYEFGISNQRPRYVIGQPPDTCRQFPGAVRPNRLRSRALVGLLETRYLPYRIYRKCALHRADVRTGNEQNPSGHDYQSYRGSHPARPAGGSTPPSSYGQAGRIATSLVSIELVIPNDLDYLPFSLAGGALVFRLLSRLCEHTTVAVTTNLDFGQ